MTTSEVLTKYKELVILLDEEEKRENSLNEQKDKRVLLKD